MRFAALIIFLIVPLAAKDASISIDAAKPGSYRIPRTIYGTFLEAIGHSIYPGLWAQILENPSFEDNLWNAAAIGRMVRANPALERASGLGLPLPWEPLDQNQGERYEPRWGDAANSQRSLLVMGLPANRLGVRQKVYLPVHRVLRYRGSIWARHIEGPAQMEVAVRDVRVPIRLAGARWTRYEFEIAVPAGAVAPLEPVYFEIAVTGETRVLIDQVFLFPADAVDGMDPDMIAMSRALKTPLVRSGGNFTSGYHWRDGIGPIDKRVTMLNQAWGMPEYNHFGTDEFLRFCKLIGAEPQIALNLGSGTPSEAADWVRYVNRKWGSPGLLWELGNELWGTFQIGYPTLERIAARTRTFSEAVREVDPKARLIATGQDPDHFREWNAEQLALPPGTFQYLSTHFVVGSGAVKRKHASTEFVTESALALPAGLERALRQMHEQAGTRARIAFTEWLFHGPNDEVPRFTNMGGALQAAGFLNALMRVADFTPIADMTGLIEFGGIWKKRGKVYGVPAYWALRMYSNADAVTPVEIRTESPVYNVSEGNRRIPEIRDVPYLDVVAALSEQRDRLTLFGVNRDTAHDITAQIVIAGFKPTRARVQMLAGTSIHQANDEEHPEAVRPVESDRETAASFRYTFPKASVTVMELR